MNRIILNVLEKFLLCITICVVFSIIITGKIAVEESGRQMIDGVEYVSAELENNEKTIDFYVGKKLYSLDKTFAKAVARTLMKLK